MKLPILSSLLLVFCLLSIEGTFGKASDYVEATSIKHEFEKTYKSYFGDIVFGVDVSTLQLQHAFHNITLTHNEDWTDFCLDVAIGVNIPKPLLSLLPVNFLEFRVFYHQVNHGDDSKSEEGEGTICLMSVVWCPDGSYAKATGPRCTPQCGNGSLPTGGKTYEEVRPILDHLVARMDGSVYNYYVSTLAAETISSNITLLKGETLADFCLVVVLFTTPESFIPSVFEGVRVFYYYHNNNAHDSVENESSSVAFPWLFVVLGLSVSALSFCLRKRRQAKRCSSQQVFHLIPQTPVEDLYPHQSFEQQKSTDNSVSLNMIPPGMHMNGTFPYMIMHNGVQYIMPHPQYYFMQPVQPNIASDMNP